ncbi:MAG TPA: hypothetical protein VLC52_07880 [Anaerolineae bacterium]|nr:hypothetical protein [Anaerolineae bacterium]
MSLELETSSDALSLSEETPAVAGSWDEPPRRSYYYLGGQRVAMRDPQA